MMNVMINRLDPNVPDPVESRRRAAGRFVRIAYAAIVFGGLAFFVVYFGAPFVYLSGPGTVSAPRYVVSLPYTVQVSHMSLVAGARSRPAKRSERCVRRSRTALSQLICAHWRTSPVVRQNCASRLVPLGILLKRRAPICA